MGEVRIRVPLPVIVPIVAVVVIAALAVGFARVLLSVPAEAATVLALATAANILIAGAFIAMRPRMHRVGVMEVALIALYPVVIGIVIANVGIGEEAATAEPVAEQPAGGGADVALVAQSVQFDTESITLPARADVTVSLDNRDSVAHNLSIYANEADGQAQTDPIFDGADVAGGASTVYDFTAPPKGEYYFQCDLHPAMNGTVTAE
jgi:plastocyanin